MLAQWDSYVTVAPWGKSTKRNRHNALKTRCLCLGRLSYKYLLFSPFFSSDPSLTTLHTHTHPRRSSSRLVLFPKTNPTRPQAFRNGYYQEHRQVWALPLYRHVGVHLSNSDISFLSYVSDKVNEATSGASKEANKNVAKDSNASLGTRGEAAKDAIGDKLDETKHSVRSLDPPLLRPHFLLNQLTVSLQASAEANKQATTH